MKTRPLFCAVVAVFLGVEGSSLLASQGENEARQLIAKVPGGEQDERISYSFEADCNNT